MSSKLGLAQRRFFEGPHPWGSYQVNAGRSGVIHYRLTVYAPGTNAAERRVLARARDWPIVGAVGALLAIVVLGKTVGSLPVMTCVVAAYVLGIAWTRVRSRALRSAVRTVDAVKVHDGVRNVSRGELSLIVDSIASLRALDENSAGLTAVDYEARWAEIYRSLDAESGSLVRQPPRLAPRRRSPRRRRSDPSTSC
jgi:hypothetical protein